MKSINHFFVFMVVATLLIGCASRGQKIDHNTVNKIEIGITSKDEMYEMFGTPLSQSYGSEGKLTMIWHYIYVGPFATNIKQQNLAVLFNENEKVEKYNLIDSTER